MINPVFFAGSNLIDLARSVSFLLIVSVGVTYVLLGASLDMSIGSVMGLGGAICGLCLVNSLPVWFSILMGLLASAVVGIVNAVLIVNCRIPALIATLGTMYVARGIVNDKNRIWDSCQSSLSKYLEFIRQRIIRFSLRQYIHDSPCHIHGSQGGNQCRDPAIDDQYRIY